MTIRTPKNGWRHCAAGVIAAVSLFGCNDMLPPLTGTASLRITVQAPTDVGSLDARIATLSEVTLTAEALDHQGLRDASFTATVDVYAQFLGSLTPERGTAPLGTIALQGGISQPTVVPLPAVFGPTFLWVEDAQGDAATYATGTSPTLWFSDPYTRDISRPTDEAALNAFERSALRGKQVSVQGSRHGASGRLVVTGIYAQGYTVSDVLCQDATGAPPCSAEDYDHMYVFTFSRPKDEAGRSLAVGQFIDGYAGAVQDFNGLTEISFPQTFASDTSASASRLPAPVVVQGSWFSDEILFERQEAGLLAINNATVCPLDEEWETYKQWKMDIGNGCGDGVVNIITTGIAEIDPTALAGQQLASVVGTLRPVNIGSFNVWILYPRDAADITP